MWSTAAGRSEDIIAIVFSGRRTIIIIIITTTVMIMTQMTTVLILMTMNAGEGADDRECAAAAAHCPRPCQREGASLHLDRTRSSDSIVMTAHLTSADGIVITAHLTSTDGTAH